MEAADAKSLGWFGPLLPFRPRHTRARSQGTSEIGGRVLDDQGGALPGVNIVVTNETGLYREVTSGADGSYFASQLTPGRYRLSAKLPASAPPSDRA